MGPAHGKETYNQAYGVFNNDMNKAGKSGISPEYLENRRDWFLSQLGLFKNAALPHISETYRKVLLNNVTKNPRSRE